MALQKKIKFKGMDVIDSYMRITHFTGNKNQINFNVQIYANQEIATIEPSNYLYITKMFSFIPNLESKDNLWKQAYLHLKEQDEFIDSEDVLEVATSVTESTINGDMLVNWGGEDIRMWAITKSNYNNPKIGKNATVFLVTINDMLIGLIKQLAKREGFDVVAEAGNSDAGVLLLRHDTNKPNFQSLLDCGKITIIAITEPENKQLVKVDGGFETNPSDNIGFGTTDNINTTGEFFKTDAENTDIIKNGEDDGYVWHKGSDMKNFRGGWMGLKWNSL